MSGSVRVTSDFFRGRVPVPSSHAVSMAGHQLRARVMDAILWGGLTAGLLDGLDAVITSIVRGSTPLRMFQGIAYGLYGREAFAGGLPMAFLGMAIHFFIAFSAAAVFTLAATRLPVLVRRWVPCGMAYGLIVWAVMRYIVIPLSVIGTIAPLVPLPFLNQLFAHTILVGLPIAWFARRALHRA